MLLAEKRTALASLRTGVAVFALPLSVLSALIATSRYYSIEKVMPLLAPNASEPGLGRARLLAGLPFHPPHTSLRTSYPGAQREISINRRVHRVAPRATKRQQTLDGSLMLKPIAASFMHGVIKLAEHGRVD